MRMVVLALTTVCWVAATAADEVEDRLKLGLELYSQGKYREAAEELQYALGEIQSKRDASYTELLPAPLVGWRAGEPTSGGSSLGMLGLGANVSRDYYALSGTGQASVQIVGDSPMVAALAMVLANPMLAQMDPDSEPYRHRGHPGMMKHAAGSRQWEIMLLVGGRVLITVTSEDVEDRNTAEAYLNAIDLNQVADAFGL